MTIAELRSAINFGKDAVAEYKARNEEVPSFIYDRIIELQEELIEKAQFEVVDRKNTK